MEKKNVQETAQGNAKTRTRQYKTEARERAAAYLTERRAKKTSEEKKAYLAAVKEKIKEWKASLTSVADRRERKAQRKAYKAYKKRAHRARRIVAWVIVVCLLAGAGYAVAPFVQNVGAVLGLKYTTDTPEAKAALAAGPAVAAQISDEGIVLLKNVNNALPLTNTRVNVFGSDAYNFKYGGSGSGGADQSDAKDIFEGLKDAGISYNETLHQLYVDLSVAEGEKSDMAASLKAFVVGTKTGDDLDVGYLSDEVMTSAKAYSEHAIIVLGNEAVEAADCSAEALQVTPNRRALIQRVAESFEHVIIIVNAGNAMELGILDEFDSIEAALWVGTPGPYGCVSIGKILAGQVNPSGRLVDTYAHAITSSPASVNFGSYKYNNYNMAFINYNEGIYVGYRYYETRYAGDEAGYRQAVQYPFGYGLSYTEFAWETESFTADDQTVAWEVKVTNTGGVAGKDVVELYFSAPYVEGGIEKSAIELADYAKTALLAPGESETVTLSFALRDMSSYDMRGAGAYVLDAGEYSIKLAKNVHDIVDTRSYTVQETVTYDTDEVTGAAIGNRFAYGDSGLTYLSRSDWQGTFPDNTDLDYTAPAELIAAAKAKPAASTAAMPTTGAVNGIRLADLKGLDYDDPKWEAFLDQFTAKEMIELFSRGAYRSIAIDRLGVPATKMLDGPAGVNSMLVNLPATAYPTEVVVASTWNDELAGLLGETAGREAVAYGLQVWYAPAMNLHRTTQGGRNFEYYSEDPLLSGRMAAATTRGAEAQGVIITIKHFAMNNEETNARSGIYVWCNEQALRELYLRPFEIAVKEGGAHGVMSSFSHIGYKWCGGNPELLQDVLRGEWGFSGFVTTDAVLSGFMDAEKAARYGNDLMLETGIAASERKITKAYRNDPVGITLALRDRTHNLCYAFVNYTKLFG